MASSQIAEPEHPTLTLASGETFTPAQAAERLKLLAGEWSTRDDEELCAHEIGDMLALVLFVLGVK